MVQTLDEIPYKPLKPKKKLTPEQKLRQRKIVFKSKTRLNKESGCWNWFDTPRGNYNYGDYRTSWKLFKGPIIKGLEIDHLCRNRWCVNPNHLDQITKEEHRRRHRELTAFEHASLISRDLEQTT